MAKICLGCCELVEENINENYNGITIHYGQDWYCGPVVEVANDVVDGTVKILKSERSQLEYLMETAQQGVEPNEESLGDVSDSLVVGGSRKPFGGLENHGIIIRTT